MSIFKEIKNWINEQKFKREMDDLVYYLNSEYELYQSDLLNNSGFINKVANYFSLLYNDLHYSNFDDKLHEMYNESVSEWSQNFIEAQHMRLEDVRNEKKCIEEAFNLEEIDIKKALFKDEDGELLSEVIETPEEIKEYEDAYNQLDYYNVCLLENQVKDEISLIQALSQAIQNGGIRREGMPFMRGGVVTIKLDDFIKYEKDLDDFVENINVPDNPNMFQFKKALKAYEKFVGCKFDLNDYASCFKSIKDYDPENVLDNSCLIFDLFYESYSEYQKQLHNLDVYKNITIYDQMLIPNCDMVKYVVDPALALAPTELPEVFKMLDKTDSRITIDKRFVKHYSRKLLKEQISPDQAKEHLQVSDSNDIVSDFILKDDAEVKDTQRDTEPTK